MEPGTRVKTSTLPRHTDAERQQLEYAHGTVVGSDELFVDVKMDNPLEPPLDTHELILFYPDEIREI